MNDELPKVYANPIDHELNNNKDVFFSSLKEERTNSRENISREVNEIFANPHHVYKSRVLITIDGVQTEEVIVGKFKDDILTLNGRHININQIQNIKRI